MPDLTEDQMRQLLAEAATALLNATKAALVVKGSLDKPYPDNPEWTPWTKFMSPPVQRAFSLGVEIRRQLRASQPGAGDPGTGDTGKEVTSA